MTVFLPLTAGAVGVAVVIKKPSPGCPLGVTKAVMPLTDDAVSAAMGWRPLLLLYAKVFLPLTTGALGVDSVIETFSRLLTGCHKGCAATYFWCRSRD